MELEGAPSATRLDDDLVAVPCDDAVGLVALEDPGRHLRVGGRHHQGDVATAEHAEQGHDRGDVVAHPHGDEAPLGAEPVGHRVGPHGQLGIGGRPPAGLDDRRCIAVGLQAGGEPDPARRPGRAALAVTSRYRCDHPSFPLFDGARPR